jgi:uncharacterized protein (TIGR00106 family)
MAPHGQGESLSAHEARILDIVDRSGVPYRLTPMGTILEGEWEEVMGVVTACFKNLQSDCSRVGMNLKVDYRAGLQAGQQGDEGRSAPGAQAQHVAGTRRDPAQRRIDLERPARTGASGKKWTGA